MYSIGYDIGSSSIKAALIRTDNGQAISVVSEPPNEMHINAPQNGWAEQDPNDWWHYVCAATKRLLLENQIDSSDITGIGIAYQMHGLVIVDDSGTLLRDSIIWCDGRAVEIGKAANHKLGGDKCSQHLLNSPANFTASKLKWVKENEPDIYNRIFKIMLPGDFIAYKLSGTITTTISGLSEGIFWDFKQNKIAEWLLDHFGLDKNNLPEIKETFALQGKVDNKGSQESGLAVGTPILYRAGDQPNNALSLNVFNPGEVAATGGTSGVVYAVTASPATQESSRINNFAHVNFSPEKVRIGKLLCINGAGIQYRWLLNNLNVNSYAEMNELAASVPIGSDGVTIHPFGNGAERMLNNIDLGTKINNLNLNNHNKAHLCRASLEGIAFSFIYGIEIMKSDQLSATVIRAGNDNLFRSEVFSTTIATLIDQEIEIYNTTGAIGAGRACMLHKGDFEAYGKHVMENDFVKSITPANDSKPYVTAYRKWKNELELYLKNQ